MYATQIRNLTYVVTGYNVNTSVFRTSLNEVRAQ
jgi:hypothetical protein